MAATISPKTSLVTPGGRVNFSAASGTPPYVYSILTNRSGGSIDATTGEYLAGPHGLVTDTVRVTDGVAATDDATVLVSAGLYQNAQRTIAPPFLRQPNALIIEGNYGAEKDWQVERARQGLQVNLIGYGPADVLDYVADERQLPRAHLLDGTPNETDDELETRLQVSWTSDDGNYVRGTHAGVLHALDRAGYPMGTPDGAHVMQAYKRWSWLTAAGGTPVYGTHARRWKYGGVPREQWNRWSIIFGADVPELLVNSAAADEVNRIASEWGPVKGVFMGTWIVVSGLAWGWPPGVNHWGDPGLVWGGVVRFIPPPL